MESWWIVDNLIEKKSFAFAVRIVKLYKLICEDRKEYTLSKQLLRSGTSIGANVSEAEMGQSRADFYAKLFIALKEANETYYWLRLLHETEYITANEFKSIERDVKEIISILVSICKTRTEVNEK